MTQYIDKSAVVAEIEDWRDKIKKGIFSIPLSGKERAYATHEYEVLGKVISFLDTFEVKEIDLEKEIKEEYLNRRCYGGRDNMLVILNELQFNKIAKHFFELGLKIK